SGAVDPTPVIGMVGLLARADRAVPSHARSPGDVVFVLGETQAEFGGSVLWEALHGFVGGVPPRVDLAAERRLVDFLVAGAERALFRSAHDCSQGGLGVALAEVAMSGPYDDTGFGLDVDLTTYGLRLAALELLFSESHGRAGLTCQAAGAAAAVAVGPARSHRGMGLVSDVFDEQVLSQLPGDVAIGHTRYSTAGTSVLANAQPMLARYREGPLALAHNGNLTNAVQLRSDLVTKGSI